MPTFAFDRSDMAKLAPPIFYTVACIAYFVIAWPDNVYIFHVAGCAVAVMACVLWVLARLQLGKAFAIRPQSKYLVRSGIYSKLRHPVYYFSSLAFIGMGLFIWQYWVVGPVILLLFVQAWRIYKEEHILLSAFGKEYEAYKKVTWF